MVTVYLTDKKIPFNREFIKKLDLMIERVTQKNPKLDAVFQNEGGEGLGKTTFSAAQGYYIAWKTGKSFSNKNLFFDLRKAIEFGKSTENQIIIFDEPAKGVLKAQWRNKLQQDLIELLMLSRKKRHFIIFNFVKFYKFNEYIVVDRSIGMIHCYSRKNVQSGRFRYIKRKNLEPLWRDYRFGKKRNYAKYTDPVTKGTFPDVLNPKYANNVLSEFNINKYESEKDQAISSIGVIKKVDTPSYIQMQTRIKILRNLKNEGIDLTQTRLSAILGIKPTTLREYTKKIALAPELNT